ncbi:hypothetical protein UFOVP755_49 [uncultured Caudovirales phage]|uniref:Uncharacterized protein n=1 Tax=uncultured Caudovirales phage TaxID=2100421 RepID=A0A6J7X5I8_9CAUD|nr:hypothetical protein UFOVP755_49 [uncultured Caudovirales phage]
MTVKKSIPKQDQAKTKDQAKTQDQVQVQDQTQIAVGQSQDQHSSENQGQDMKKNNQDQTQSQDQAQDQKKIVAVLSSALMSMLTSPKTKQVKQDQAKTKSEKKAFKNLQDQFIDYTALSLSFFGQVISLNDVKSKVALSKDFDDQVSSLVNRSSIGSIDKDTNFSGSIVFNGSQAVNLIDHQVFCFSKSYSEDKNDKTHQGVYSWQAQKFVKLVLINQAIKSNKSLKIDQPSSCPFVSLSWSSFASALLSLGCPLMSIEKISILKKSFDHDLIDHLNNEKLLLEIDLSFSSILSLGQPKQDQNQVKA